MAGDVRSAQDEFLGMAGSTYFYSFENATTRLGQVCTAAVPVYAGSNMLNTSAGYSIAQISVATPNQTIGYAQLKMSCRVCKISTGCPTLVQT